MRSEKERNEQNRIQEQNQIEKQTFLEQFTKE